MRILLALALVASALAGCGGYTPGPQEAALPGSGGAVGRDDFYDGGIFDRDLVPDPGDTGRDSL